MVARHAATLATITKSKAFTKVNNAFSTIQKIATYQIPIPPPALPVAGGGVSVGSGTSFPVLYPIAELGNNHGTITINLANQNLHYQKMNINAAGVSSVVFSGLLLNKAIVFTLDVTIGIAGVTALNWPANLYNLPTLPITNGSRYVLYISGFKDGSEERYEVVGSSLTGGGGSTNWSSIVIDVDKNMLGHGLNNLGFIDISTVGGAPGAGTDYFMSGDFSDINVISTATNKGHNFLIDGTSYLQIIHNTAATPFADFILAQVPFNVNNEIMYNINDLEFKSTGLAQKITTSNDGKVFNFFNSNVKTMDVSRADNSSSGGILEVYDGPFSGASIKCVSNQNPPVSGQIIGSFSWDSFNAGGPGSQQSFAQWNGYAAKVNIGAEIGRASLFVRNTAVSAIPIEMLRVSQEAGVVGFDFRNNQLFNIESLQFGTTLSSLTDDGTRLFVNMAGSEFFRLQQTGTPYLDFTPTEIIPQHNITAGISDVGLGDSSHVFNSIDVKIVNIWGLMAFEGSLAGWISDVYCNIDNNNNLGTTSKRWANVYLSGFLQNYEAGSTNKYISINKNTSNHNVFYNLNDATNTSAYHHFSVNSTNVFSMNNAGTVLYSPTNNAINFQTNITSFGYTTFFHIDTTDSNTGFAFQIDSASGNKSYLQIIHNTGNDPIDFLYAQVPLWMVSSYIQLDEISDPTTPATDKARLYIKDNGSGKSALVIKWESGTVSTIFTEP